MVKSYGQLEVFPRSTTTHPYPNHEPTRIYVSLSRNPHTVPLEDDSILSQSLGESMGLLPEYLSYIPQALG